MNSWTTRVEELELRHTFTISRGSQDVCPVVISELSSEGVTGYGEASPSSFYDEDCDSVCAALEAEREWIETADLETYHHFLEEASERLSSSRAALCALDLATFDWFSRRVGRPLWRLLGLDPERVPASSFTIGIDTTERMVEKTREASSYPILKVKLGTEPDRDLEIIRAMRAVSDATFRVDANCAWTPEETIEKSGELGALGVEFIEQPLPPERLEDMEKVYRESALPLVADENSVIPAHVPALRDRFHGINIKLVKCGGLLPAMRMIHLARTLGLRIMYGCMIESSVSITAAAQIGALADWLDLDGNVLIRNDPYRGARNENGRLLLPEGFVERL